MYDNDYNATNNMLSVDFTFSSLNSWYTGVYRADIKIDRLVVSNEAELQVICKL